MSLFLYYDIILHMTSHTICIAIITLLLLAPVSAHAQNAIIENFSALDCPQSPDSEANLKKIIEEKKDVLVLSCHVKVNKEDTKFSNPLCAEKKSRYISRYLLNSNAAPTIVVNGTYLTKGFYPKIVNSAINMALAENEIKPLPLKIENGILTTTLPDQVEKGYYEIWFYAYDKAEIVPFEVKASALNSAFTYPVTYNNVVKHIKRLGTWNGLGESIAIPLKDTNTDGYAIIAQGVRAGPVLTAGYIEPDKPE